MYPLLAILSAFIKAISNWINADERSACANTLNKKRKNKNRKHYRGHTMCRCRMSEKGKRHNSIIILFTRIYVFYCTYYCYYKIIMWRELVQGINTGGSGSRNMKEKKHTHTHLVISLWWIFRFLWEIHNEAARQTLDLASEPAILDCVYVRVSVLRDALIAT